MTLAQRVEELVVFSGGDSKRAIGEFVLQKKGRLCEFTTQQIADETYTSKSALVRFAKALGFPGWKDFTKEFVSEQHYQETHYSDIDPNIPFNASSSTEDIISRMCSLQMESLTDTADMIEPWVVDKVVDLMIRSNRIALFGINPNHLLGELFYRRMLTVGKLIELPTRSDSGLLAASLKENDCAIIISYSGNSSTSQSLNMLRFLEANHVPIVAVTSLGPNDLRQHAAYTLSISSREKLFSKISTFATETSILYILNVLFSAYFAHDFQANFKRKVDNGRVLEQQRFSLVSELREDNPEV